MSNFRKKMMEEEKASEDHEEGPERRISYGMLPVPDTGKDRSASIADVQIKSEVKDELANLFS